MRICPQCDKHTHADAAKAAGHRESLRRRDLAAGRQPRPMVVYFCTDANGYHVGKPSPHSVAQNKQLADKWVAIRAATGRAY